jgi:hypothetical protein
VKWSGLNLVTENPVAEGCEKEEWETLAPIYEPIEASALDVLVSRQPPLSLAGHAASRGFATARDSDAIVASALPKAAEAPWYHQQDQFGDMHRFAGPMAAMGSLPIQASQQNAVLVHTFSELLHHFKGSFDGIPDPDNPFVNKYVPWCLHSPLLAQTSLYIAARSLAERGFVDQRAAMRIRGRAIHALNEHLQSDAWSSDEAMAAVVQLISIEWFFGETEVVLAHLGGLREMARLRGGFTAAGVGALVTKVALV